MLHPVKAAGTLLSESPSAILFQDSDDIAGFEREFPGEGTGRVYYQERETA